MATSSWSGTMRAPLMGAGRRPSAPGRAPGANELVFGMGSTGLLNTSLGGAAPARNRNVYAVNPLTRQPIGATSYAGGSAPPLNFSVQSTPQLQAVMGEMQQYRSGLAAGSDADAQFAMQRQRDLASGMAKEGLQGAIDRGFSGDSGYAQQRRLMGLDAGQKALAGLNTSLTSDARKQQLSALQGQGALASASAGADAAQQGFLLNQWQAQQSALQAQAQLQAMQQQQQFDNLMRMNSIYTG